MNFESPIWTETEIDVFEQEKKIQLPEEYKACLMKVGEISRDYFSSLLNISLRNRLAKDFTWMKKKAIPATKIHNVGSLCGKGWINENCFKV
ncbi:hypothetical protein [Xanthocytophaga agilis]|uniref:SMI1/KNR4 family protein n=1 Tax=Xanthocytophaga agilis TaxID=3048010 RepID=A0AAE3UK36_9BACT|nr:hypothetical protein [Xanthocytophaga agilis]MDJ1506223.1 hypothetical protein [Xanthocytophaga agilis]